MSDHPAIRIYNLGKKYRLGGPVEKYSTIRDTITNSLKSRFKSGTPVGSKEFWALKNVTFEVEQGEIVGIIGRNGAGKSTLLKILARITSPTEGSVEIYGRVGSLLEVGTGFHPELTGRENIFLSGSILGMKRQEIEAKLEEIVEFSEIEKFLDTPVKRYSSGMYVRLAFAVAAHLEPEILLIDEVLAVGDAAFQKKCLGKMGEVAKEGRTVLFVSHNMAAIRRICSRVILIDSGQISRSGDVDNIISYYLQNSLLNAASINIQQMIDSLPQDKVFRLKQIEVIQNGGILQKIVENGKPLEIVIHYQVKRKTKGLRVYFDLCDNDDTILFRSFHDELSDGVAVMEPGDYISKAVIPPNLLGPVHYQLKIFATIFNERGLQPVKGITIPFHVENTGNYNRAYPQDSFRGKLGLVIPWTIQKI